jgi:hypothetical protein
VGQEHAGAAQRHRALRRRQVGEEDRYGPRAVAELGDGRFVAQIAYTTGEKAPVSVVAKRSTRIISWSHVKLKTVSKTGLT